MANGKMPTVVIGRCAPNPATEQVIASLPFGGQVDAVAGVDASAAAFERWKKTTPYERAIIFNKASDYILVHAELFAADHNRNQASRSARYWQNGESLRNLPVLERRRSQTQLRANHSGAGGQSPYSGIAPTAWGGRQHYRLELPSL